MITDVKQLAQAVRRAKLVCFDGDGVLWTNKVLPGAAELLKYLKEKNISTALVTNNSSRTREQFCDRIASSMGLSFSPEEIYCTAHASAKHLYERGYRHTFLIGPESIATELEAVGITVHRPINVSDIHEMANLPDLHDNRIDSVLLGHLQHSFSYQIFAEAVIVLQHLRNTRGEGNFGFFISNRDLTFPLAQTPPTCAIAAAKETVGCAESAGEGAEVVEKQRKRHNLKVPGSGACATPIIYASGMLPEEIGKPAGTMLRAAAADNGIENMDDVLMFGDRLTTDVAAATRAQARGVLVETGIHRREDVEELMDRSSGNSINDEDSVVRVEDLFAERIQAPPAFVVEDLATLVRALELLDNEIKER